MYSQSPASTHFSLPHVVFAEGPPAPRVGAVDNVVMNQRGGVHHLHHRAQSDGARARVAQHVRRQQQQRRPDALAAALPQVFGNLRDRAYAGGGVPAQLLLDRHQVVPQQIEDLSRRRYRQCAQCSPVFSVSLPAVP